MNREEIFRQIQSKYCSLTDELMNLKMIGVLSLLFALSFIAASIFQQQHAEQYIFFLLIGVLTLLGCKRQLDRAKRKYAIVYQR